MDRLVRFFHGGVVKQNGELENMNESIEIFDGPPSFSDLVDRVMTKYGCRVDEISLRGRFDCGKARAHYVLMKLASDANWKHYKDVVHEANVACLEVIVEIVRMPGPNVVMREEVTVVNHNGTQESEMLHHVLGETERDFDLAIANDDFPNNIFERDEANIDVDNVSMGSEDCELEEDGVVGEEVEEESLFESGGHEYENVGVENEEDGLQFDTATVHDVEGIRRMDDCFSYTQCELRMLKERDVELPSVPNDKDISMVHKAICESSMVNAEGTSIGESPVIKKGMKFNSLEELKFFLADYAVRLHRPFSVVHSDKNLRYNVMCKQGCRWRVWSRLISSTGQWRISNLSPAAPGGLARQGWPPAQPTESRLRLARQHSPAAPGGLARQGWPPAQPTESRLRLARQHSPAAPGGLARQGPTQDFQYISVQ
uniref:Transposase MuDR plant domain-containing protein n=3 Tax=Setaria italica TaxID=4555 RepID=K3ZDC5_SETIT